jgi:CDP-diacylglycerol--glycerol-3-phosphate 3-phosphatidyltransferase
MSGSNLNIPNVITFSRIVFVPVIFIVLLSSPGRTLSLWGAVLFTLASVTDFLDGYIARRMNRVTSLGKFLDPLADKLLVGTALIMMIQLERVPPWIVALIVGRELFVTGLRVVAIRENMIIETTGLAKYKTVLQIVAVVCLMIHYEYTLSVGALSLSLHFHRIGMGLLGVALAVTLWTGGDYCYRFFRKMSPQQQGAKEEKKNNGPAPGSFF